MCVCVCTRVYCWFYCWQTNTGLSAPVRSSPINLHGDKEASWYKSEAKPQQSNSERGDVAAVMLRVETSKSVGGTSGQWPSSGSWSVFLFPSLLFREILEEIFESAFPKFDLYVFVSLGLFQFNQWWHDLQTHVHSWLYPELPFW